MTERPKRIWAWPNIKYDGDGSYVENYIEGEDQEDATEYVRADSVPDFRKLAERIAGWPADVKTIDDIERILREALEVHDE